MKPITGGIDAVAVAIGRAVAWLLLPMLLAAFGLVLARYAFGIGSIATQEAVLWLHATVFMLGSAWALQQGKHVRVDVFSARASQRTRAWIELLGCVLFLLPFAAFLFWISLDYVAASFALRESSREPGGLPALYLLKGLIPASAALLFLQGVSEALKALARLREARA
jgi:TRAP-type mannitol/chloroaromatic compound transport system permease small subunit